MGTTTTLFCDLCKHIDSEYDDPRREVTTRDGWSWEGTPYELDACAKCWQALAARMAEVIAVAREVTPTPARRRSSPGSRKVREWAKDNDIELGSGPTPNEVTEAWRHNNPSLASSRYVGTGEPPAVGKMRADLRPPGWAEAGGSS